MSSLPSTSLLALTQLPLTSFFLPHPKQLQVSVTEKQNSNTQKHGKKMTKDSSLYK